jgi:hypothetical protein
MIRILAALCLLLGLATPAQAATCECRIASVSETSTDLYLIGYNGNRVEWGGTSLTIPSGWQTKITNAGLNPSTLYYVYVYGSSTPALELSVTGHATDANGNEVKQGDGSRLLVGMVYTDANGKFVRSARDQLILNWWNRLPIFAAAPAACTPLTTAQPAWQELGTGSNNLIRLLTWGYQLGISNNLVMGISGSASNNVANGRMDFVFGFMELGPTMPVSSWISVTSAAANQWQNISGASTMGSPEGLRTVTFWGRSYGGGTGNVCVNTFASTNG